MDDIIPDPLRAISAQGSLLSTPAPTVAQERLSPLSVSKGKLDEQAKAAATEWEAHRATILHRFTSSDTIKVSPVRSNKS